MKKLPVLDIAQKAFHFIKDDYLFLFKVFIPQLVLVLSIFLLLYDFNIEAVSAVHVLSVLVLGLMYGFSLVLMIIAIHRKLILNESSNNKWIQWTGNEIKYIGWLIVIGLCVFLICIPGLFMMSQFLNTEDESILQIGQALGWVLYLAISYVVARWSLVLPSSAVGEHGNSLSWSWDLSDGNGWRLTALIALPVMLLDFLPAIESEFYSFTVMLAWVGLSIFEIVALSLSFQFLKNQQKENTVEEIQSI